MSLRVPAEARRCMGAAALVAAGLLAAGPAAGQSRVTLADWELACDNTRTCRAVGYQSDEARDLPLALLVEREAGPGKPAKVQVMLGGEGAARHAAADLVVDGRTYGPVLPSGREGAAGLTPAQAAVLLRAVIGTGDVVFQAQDNRWVLSTSGAAGVLMRMDDLQGRVDTAGALVRKGSVPESKVLPALAPPLVRAAALVEPRSGDEELVERIRPLLRVGPHDRCDSLEPLAADAEPGSATHEPITVTRLSADRVLLSMQCWQDHHVSGHGVWHAADRPPYAPQLVTANATGIRGNLIEADQPARHETGDCWSHDQWTWDGGRFIHTSSSTTGLCKQVAAGGAWTLPTIVTAGGIPPER